MVTSGREGLEVPVGLGFPTWALWTFGAGLLGASRALWDADQHCGPCPLEASSISQL